MLKVSNISKKYKDFSIFSNVSFEVAKGETVSIIGKSGSGKSTLLKCINKLEKIDEGKIYFNNKNIDEINLVELRQNIGIVFQDYNLFEHLTVLDNLIIGLIKIKNENYTKAKRKAINILEKIGLEDKINNYPDELSGGQKQRVAIARSLLLKPKILLLDEPTSALDKEMKEEVWKLIVELKEEGMTLIIVSHEEDFVKRVSDRIFKMVDKQLIQL